jgi:hypothetical protein
MTNLQRIESAVKEHGVSFVRQNATLNGVRLYNFEDAAGNVIGRMNWTIAGAASELDYGTLVQIVCEQQ